MCLRIILLILSSSLLFTLTSCETKPSTADRGRQQTTSNTNQVVVVDGVPVMPAPGSQIEKGKVIMMLKEGNLSFSEIASINGTEKDIEKSIDKLKELLGKESVRKDKELQFMVHTMLGSSYLQLYEHSGQNDHLDQAKEHYANAISIFENKPEYKADLAEPYNGLIGIYMIEKEYDKAISLMKNLIEEYQGIGFSPYKNWFASYQVQGLYNLAHMGSSSKRSQGILNYITEIGERYHNEVGITAQIALVRHYFGKDEQKRVKALSESIESRFAKLNNPAFKKDKWEPLKAAMERAKKMETEKKRS